MKYLKLFEGFDYENISISRRDFYTFTDGRNPNHLTLVPFTRREIEEIEGVLGGKKLDGRILFKSSSMWEKSARTRISDDITEIVFFISSVIYLR